MKDSFTAICTQLQIIKTDNVFGFNDLGFTSVTH